MEDQKECDISQEKQFQLKFNEPDTTMELSIDDVKKIAILKFGSVTKFGRKLGVTKSCASILLSGKYVPLKIESIKKIANVLEIEPLLLQRIYDNLKLKRQEAKENE